MKNSWMNLRQVGFVMASLLAISGCEDDKGNLAISDLQAEAHQSRYGEEITINYQFDSRGFLNGEADVQFVLVHSEELNQIADQSLETELSEVHVVGLQTLPLNNAISERQTTILLPETIVGGDYELIAHIDPDNLIDEENEQDNAPHLDDGQGGYHHTVLHIEGPPDHDHHLQNLSLGIEQLILDRPDLDGHGEAHRSDIIGHVDVRYHGAHSDSVTLVSEIEIEGNWYPIRFWDSATARYQEGLTVDLMLSDQANHIGFDVVLEAEHIEKLWAGYQQGAENQAAFRLRVHDDALGRLESHADNNQLEFTLPLYFFANPSEPAVARSGIGAINYEQSFDATYGDESKFAVGVELYGNLALIPLVDPGASVSGSGDVSAYFFNAHNTLFGISFDGSAYASGNNTGYAAEMVVFNATILDEEHYTNTFSKEWAESWEEERVLASARFMVGPIPMSVEAGVSGELGFEMGLGYNAELTGGGDLFNVDFGAFGRGGIDLLIASGGVQAIFNLLANTFSLDSTAGFELANNGQVDPHIYYEFVLQDAIDAVSGKFGLYADLKGIKWCKKWFIPYPCGTKTTRYDLWLYQTPSVFEKTWTLLSKSGEVPL